MDSFTPLSAMAGGALIGLAAAILWLGNGRIAGISGILGRLFPPYDGADAGGAAVRKTAQSFPVVYRSSSDLPFAKKSLGAIPSWPSKQWMAREAAFSADPVGATRD